MVGEDRAITWVFYRDLHLTAMFFGLHKKVCLKEIEVCRKVILNKIIVLLVTRSSSNGLLLSHKVCHLFLPLPSCCLFIYFILFYLPHNNYKKYRKRRKKEVARRPNRNYRSLWEVRPSRTMS